MAGPIPAGSQRQVGAIPSGDGATRIPGNIADRPAASAANNGFEFAALDTGVLYWSNGATWTAVADLGGGGGGGEWGDITGDLEDQTDLQDALDDKQDAATALQLGETSATAYRGDRGKTAFDHTALTNNPHSVTKTQVGLSAVTNDAQAKTASNLSDLASAPTSRANINVPILASAQAVATTNVSSLSGTTTIDGTAVIAGDIVLLAGQTTGSQNGPWTIAAGSWTRPLDYAAASTVRGRLIQINAGTIWAGTVWALLTATTVTVDTTATTWSATGVRKTAPLTAGRLIVPGHSMAASPTSAFGGAAPWIEALGSTDGSRFAELLADMFAVDRSNEFIRAAMPSLTATSSFNAMAFVPEEGILWSVYYLPSGALTGAATNNRTHKVFWQRFSSNLETWTRSYDSGVNLAFGQASRLLDLAIGQVDATSVYRSAANGLEPRGVAMAAGQPWTSSLFAWQSALIFQSAAVSLGVAEPGGTVVFRWLTGFRPIGVGGSRLVKSGMYHGGWATLLAHRPPRHVYGPEVNATPGESGGATAVRCDALEFPIPSGSVISFTGGVNATTTADAFGAATTISVSALSGAIANGEQGVARSSTTGGYHQLTPLGLHTPFWGRNDAVRPTIERTGWKEAVRAAIAMAQCSYYQASDRANIVAVAGNGAGASWGPWSALGAGQFISPWTMLGRAVKRFTGAVGATPPTLTIKLPPAFEGGVVDLFFAAQAGATRGGAATITADAAFNGGTACTINTTSACLNENITTGLAGTVSGTTTFTLTTGTFTGTGLIDQIGTAISGTAGTGSIAAGTKIASITSSTVATLDTPGTNGTVTAVETRGYVPMVKRMNFGGVAGAKTITVTLTGMDATTGAAELIFLGYGIESTPVTPVVWAGIARSPADSGDWTDVLNLNTDTLAVIAGTATNPNSGNSTEPASPAVYVDIDAPLGNGAVVSNWVGDGVHLSEKGNSIVALAIYQAAVDNFTRAQLAAR